MQKELQQLDRQVCVFFPALLADERAQIFNYETSYLSENPLARAIQEWPALKFVGVVRGANWALWI
jgi:hypothetical protein